jgi:hypothetical protein
VTFPASLNVCATNHWLTHAHAPPPPPGVVNDPSVVWDPSRGLTCMCVFLCLRVCASVLWDRAKFGAKIKEWAEVRPVVLLLCVCVCGSLTDCTCCVEDVVHVVIATAWALCGRVVSLLWLWGPRGRARERSSVHLAAALSRAHSLLPSRPVLDP